LRSTATRRSAKPRRQLDQARLNLSYATVSAPFDGIVTKVEDLQVGDFVNPGNAVFSMMSSRASGSRRISAKPA
jgi:multidrug resistance efflux pump